ncbi:MAG: EAL domain-containing protein [Sulfuricurvum sp.]|nr:EAL domain-containing protein [Sulfuricurvum sp.]
MFFVNTLLHFCRTCWLTPLSLTLFYIFFGLLWIFGSDYVLAITIGDSVIANQFEVGKGALFVIVTGSILYVLLKRWRKQLLKVHNQISSTLNAIPDLLFEVDLEGKYYDYHSPRIHLLAAPAETLLGKTVRDILPEQAAQTCLLALQEANEKGFSYDKQIEILLPQGKSWFELSVSKKLETDKESPHFIVLSRDITQRKKSEDQLLKLSQAVEQSPNTIIITDLDANIEYANAAFFKTTGYSVEEVIGKNPNLLHSEKTPSATYADMWEHLTRGENWQGEFINRRKDGTEYIEFIRIAPVRQKDGKITHYMAIKEDISERKQAEERIHYLVNFDPLTGLPNRLQMDDHMQYTLNLAKRNGGFFAVLFLDLDHFKNINDTLGHSIGDKLLIELSKRLTASLRDQDTISRMGGDEFIILLPSSDAHGTIQVAQKLLNSIAKTFLIEEYQLSITASIGIALYPNDGVDIEMLSKNADTAMYRAKNDGRNSYCFFTPEMQANSHRMLQLSNALHHALERNELHLVYQPQLSASGERIVGAEALLRWQHPEFGSVPPDEFIPIAEENGMILSIGEWVLRTAISQAKSWIDNGHLPIIVAVNISAIQFRHPNLPDLITSILEEAEFPPQYLEIELTESIAMHDPQVAINTMNDLHERGIRMSIDDFGTGYSSLSYLKKFKVYKLKIDQSFVHDIGTNSEDKAIVNAIINMARSLDLQTIAEGVETLEQLEYLRKQGCDEIQGYYYSKPLLPKDFETFVQKWKN